MKGQLISASCSSFVFTDHVSHSNSDWPHCSWHDFSWILEHYAVRCAQEMQFHPRGPTYRGHEGIRRSGIPKPNKEHRRNDTFRQSPVAATILLIDSPCNACRGRTEDN